MPILINFWREIAERALDTAITTGPHSYFLPTGSRMKERSKRVEKG
jgi:hypothetical protein